MLDLSLNYVHHQQLSSFYVGLELLDLFTTTKSSFDFGLTKGKTLPILSGRFNDFSFYLDCLDGYNWIEGDMQQNLGYFASNLKHDIVVKRNFTDEFIGLVPGRKVIHFGFNYPMGYRLPFVPWIKLLQQNPYWAIKYRHLLRGYYDFRTFEYLPVAPDPMRILYQVRLWDPGSARDSASREQRRQMNAFRVDCVRALLENFPTQAVAGVEDSDFSRALCPDLVISREVTSRNSYFKLIRQCAIGVTSNGLHQSIGWKMGEYIASSRAIVCERPYFLFPPHFLEGQNYLGFSTPEELVIQVDNLLSKPDKLSAMMQENQNYYQEYQRPDRLVWHILRQMEL